MLKKYLHIFYFFLGVWSVYAQESFNTLIYKIVTALRQENYDEASSVFMDAVKKE